jgi:hypothetical protein
VKITHKKNKWVADYSKDLDLLEEIVFRRKSKQLLNRTADFLGVLIRGRCLKYSITEAANLLEEIELLLLDFEK